MSKELNTGRYTENHYATINPRLSSARLSIKQLYYISAWALKKIKKENEAIALLKINLRIHSKWSHGYGKEATSTKATEEDEQSSANKTLKIIVALPERGRRDWSRTEPTETRRRTNIISAISLFAICFSYCIIIQININTVIIISSINICWSPTLEPLKAMFNKSVLRY
jgi:hypothetical protein